MTCRVLLHAMLVMLLVGGCRTLGLQPQEPGVRVTGVRPLSLSLSRQELGLTLAITNPNAFELPIRSFDFVALLGDEQIAAGNSDQRVVVPANGEAELEVVIVTGLQQSLAAIGRRLGRGEIELDYRVEGSVRLDNWPKRLDFDVDGTFDDRSDAARSAITRPN